jgi:hypothetical protein
MVVFDKIFHGMHHRRDAILKTFDEDKSGWSIFLPTDFCLLRARLTVFCSKERWMVALERIGFENQTNQCLNWLNVCGSNTGQRHLESVAVAANASKESADYPYFEENESNEVLVDPFNFTLEVSGQECKFTPSDADYIAIGIDPTKLIAPKRVDNLIKSLLLAVHQVPEKIFLDTSQLLIWSKYPGDLPALLQTFLWQHPDYRKQEQPSKVDCMQQLADAIAECDATLFDSNKCITNTRWTDWISEYVTTFTEE